MLFTMRSSTYLHAGIVAALSSICVFLAAAEPSIEVAYCASINTASYKANSSVYMSEGLCHDDCNDDGYALAVLQDEDCWCSNYVPDSGDQVDTDKCDSSCPGYPSDYCGGDGLYGYLKLDASVKGTSGGSSSTASATSTSTSTTRLQTTSPDSTILVESTVTETLQASVTTSSSSAASSTTLTSIKSSETSKTSSDSTSDSQTTSKTSATPTVMTSVQTVTSDGTIVYQTVTTTAKPSGSGSSALSKGAIAGTVVGILAVLLAFVAGAFLYRRHRKNQMRAEQAPLAAAMNGSHRRGSSAGIMSKTGTISSNGFPMEEDMSYGTPSRRMSMLPMDPRLDYKQTFGLYRAASHDSINTIRDDQDYSRRVHEPARALRVFNPDPTDDH